MNMRAVSWWRTRLAVALSALGLLGTAACGLAPSAADVRSRLDAAGVAGQRTDNDSQTAKQPTKAVSNPAPTPSGVDPRLASYYQQRLKWKECMPGGFQCTKLRVPLDYKRPGGPSIELAVLRSLAKDKKQRQGSLIINPGGPGGSGVEYASFAPGLFGPTVKSQFDIVGFDPRGVGKSDPVRCISDKQMDAYLAADGSPDNAAEVQRLLDLSKQMANGCEAHSGKILPYVSTENVARDMDILRGALGDTKLHYFGASYGTFIGATYAELFAKRVGVMALDGALDPAMSSEQVGIGQAEGFETALKSFVDDCVQRTDCPLGQSATEAYGTLDAFLQQVDGKPLPGKRPVTQSLAMTGIVYAMYSKDLWGYLRNGLAKALNGDGSVLLWLADQYSGRQPGGTYKDNSGEAILAVNCLDRPDITGVQDAERQQPAYEKASPRFGAYILWGSLPCAVWPVKPVGKPHAIHAPGTPPILVIGTTRDPATPYAWARNLAKELDSGVLLTNVGDGHTAYSGGVKPCIDNAVDRYLTTGTPPKKGTVCSD